MNMMQAVSVFDTIVLRVLSHINGVAYQVNSYFNLEDKVVRPLVAYNLITSDSLPNQFESKLNDLIGDPGYKVYTRKLTVPMGIAGDRFTLSYYIALCKVEEASQASSE